MSAPRTRSDLMASAGTDLGVSRWYEIGQDRITTFADVTEDWQFIHLDPDRAAAETPFGGTIAHGHLTLSMLAPMSYDVLPDMEGMTSSINYGFDKVRFIAPVRAGSRVRGHFTLAEVSEKGPDGVLIRVEISVEIEGEDKPALIADWLGLYLF